MIRTRNNMGLSRGEVRAMIKMERATKPYLSCNIATYVRLKAYGFACSVGNGFVLTPAGHDALTAIRTAPNSIQIRTVLKNKQKRRDLVRAKRLAEMAFKEVAQAYSALTTLEKKTDGVKIKKTAQKRKASTPISAQTKKRNAYYKKLRDCGFSQEAAQRECQKVIDNGGF